MVQPKAPCATNVLIIISALRLSRTQATGRPVHVRARVGVYIASIQLLTTLNQYYRTIPMQVPMDDHTEEGHSSISDFHLEKVILAASSPHPCTDWSKASNLKKTDESVEDWHKLRSTEGAPLSKSKAEFAKSRGIPSGTFQKYAHNDPAKCRKIGSKMGRNKSVDPKKKPTTKAAKKKKNQLPKNRFL
jgi:hypothetical protein